MFAVGITLCCLPPLVRIMLISYEFRKFLQEWMVDRHILVAQTAGIWVSFGCLPMFRSGCSINGINEPVLSPFITVCACVGTFAVGLGGRLTGTSLELAFPPC